MLEASVTSPSLPALLLEDAAHQRSHLLSVEVSYVKKRHAEIWKFFVFLLELFGLHQGFLSLVVLGELVEDDRDGKGDYKQATNDAQGGDEFPGQRDRIRVSVSHRGHSDRRPHQPTGMVCSSDSSSSLSTK